ncbi:MAG: hypothetical protein R3F15_21415, partial [Lysobacterales bacterium]
MQLKVASGIGSNATGQRLPGGRGRGVQQELLVEFPRQCLSKALPCFHLATRKLPLMRMVAVKCAALRQQHPTMIIEECRRDDLCHVPAADLRFRFRYRRAAEMRRLLRRLEAA